MVVLCSIWIPGVGEVEEKMSADQLLIFKKIISANWQVILKLGIRHGRR
jgi:hypothetical protein